MIRNQNQMIPFGSVYRMRGNAGLLSALKTFRNMLLLSLGCESVILLSAPQEITEKALNIWMQDKQGACSNVSGAARCSQQFDPI